MKTLLLFISFFCFAPFVSAQLNLAYEPNIAISKSNRHSHKVPKDNLAITVGSFSAWECTTDLQVYLDLNTVCNKLVLAGPGNAILMKGGVGQGGLKAGCLLIKPFSGWYEWAGRDTQNHIKVFGKMDVSLVSTITHDLNSCKSMMMAGMTSYPH